MSEELVTVKVSGLKEIQEALEQQIPKKAKAGVREGLLAGGNLFKDSVVRAAPKDTGLLAKNIDLKLSIKGGTNVAGAAYIGPKGHVDYPLAGGTFKTKANRKGRMYKVGRIPAVTVARFLEIGTSKMGAKPFMTQAFESAKDLVLFRVVKALKEALGL